MGRDFGAKIKFAKVVGKLDEETAETIKICHKFRNEVYHLGLQHEAVLLLVCRFYFQVACACLAEYEPTAFMYEIGQELPTRAREYFGDGPYFDAIGEIYRDACMSLGAQSRLGPADLSAGLADHLEDVVEAQHVAIDMIATGGASRMSRDEAVLDSMTRAIAFSEGGRTIAEKGGWRGGSVADYVRWIGEHCAMPLSKDPIAIWKKRARSIREEKRPHAALKKYRNFMDQTAKARSILEEAHWRVERNIDEQIEDMKVKRYWKERVPQTRT